MRYILASLLAILLPTTWAAAQMGEIGEAPMQQESTAAKDAHHPVQHPILPRHAEWAGLMVMIVLAMFFAAAMVGIAVRMNTPEELPDDDAGHGHDDHHDAHGH